MTLLFTATLLFAQFNKQWYSHDTKTNQTTVTILGDGIPTQGMVAWYKADSITASDGDLIDTWSDTRNGNNLIGTGTTRPVYTNSVINGKPALWFDEDKLQVTSWRSGVLNQPFVLFMVCRKFRDRQWDYIYDGGSSSDQCIMYQSGAATLSIYSGSTLAIGGAYECTNDNFNVYSVLYNGANSEVRVNGVQKATGSAGMNLMSGITVGMKQSSGSIYGFQGSMCEILIYHGARTNYYGSVEAYLSGKYGL